MRKFLLLLVLGLFGQRLAAEAFYIDKYDIRVHLSNDGVLDVVETIDVVFTEERHGIIRNMPFRYYNEAIPNGEQARRAYKGNGEITLFYKDFQVDDWQFESYKEGDYEVLRIGDPDETVDGAQRFVIRYKVYNVVSFFDDFSELYWNLIGQDWDVQINAATFRVEWDKPIPAKYEVRHFVSSGYYGRTGGNVEYRLDPSRRFLEGKTTSMLGAHEGLTVGVSFPKDFLQLAPLPPEAIAKRVVIRRHDTEIDIQKNGISKVREVFQIKVLNDAKRWNRHFYPYIDGLPTGFYNLAGGRYRYALRNLEVAGGTRCQRGSGACVKLDQLDDEGVATIIITYELYGNLLADGDRLLFQHPAPLSFEEPVLRKSLHITWPAGVTDVDFNAYVDNNEQQRDQIDVKKVGSHAAEAVITAYPFMEPGHSLEFDLAVPGDAISASPPFAYTQALWWVNNKFLFLPLLIIGLLYAIWDRWGRDEHSTRMVHYYPPADLPPSEAGIIIDDKLHDRDLLALIPYWGAHGLIEITELEKKFLSSRNYVFEVKSSLPADRPAYERTMWTGLFGSNPDIGQKTELKNLRDKFHVHFTKAKKQLEQRINERSFYVPRSRGAGVLIMSLGIIACGVGVLGLVVALLTGDDVVSREFGIGVLVSAIAMIGFGIKMPKKAPMGLEAYRQADGFKMFVEEAEMPRLEAFLKEDPHYFDKTLPYAIVFDRVEAWADKFKDLAVPPPSWYHGDSSRPFSTIIFTNQLSNAMQSAGSTFVSTPAPKSSGGSSFGGGGFSGGGFGGGGGSSW